MNGLTSGFRVATHVAVFIHLIILLFMGLFSSFMNLAGNLVTNDATNATNRYIAAQTNATNLRLAREQNEWNLEQWQREVNYNDPANQVARLKAAGLSSAAAAQSASNVPAPAMQSADLANQQTGAPMQAPDLSAISGLNIIGFARELEALRSDKAKADMLEQDREMHPRMLLSEYDAKMENIKTLRQNLEQGFKSFPYRLSSLKYQAEADKSLPALRAAQIDLSRAQREEINMNVKLARQTFDFMEKWNEQQLAKISEEIKNVVLQGQKIKADTNLTNKQAELVGSQTEGQKVQNRILSEQEMQEKIETILKENGTPEDVASRMGVLYANGVVPPNLIEASIKGTQHYIKEGYKWFGGDPVTKDFLYYYFDKGAANASKLGYQTLGGFSEFYNALRGHDLRTQYSK